MAHIVVLGAGLGGSIMAYELRDQIGKDHKITVVTKDPKYHFVPSNPWIAVGWREPDDITVDLAPILARKKVDFVTTAAKKVHADENRVELIDGKSIDYDYLIISTGPELAFDEIEGLGPNAHTQSICHVDHALAAREKFEAFCKNPGPVVIGAVQGASCYGPAYEFLFI
ncbi:MAG: FAD-dependent oxidoreductase, partial [Rhodobacteraceae bacterium]|nr:FAD-dependent oxidoreductase [Paracoccaceae bacterium]